MRGCGDAAARPDLHGSGGGGGSWAPRRSRSALVWKVGPDADVIRKRLFQLSKDVLNSDGNSGKTGNG